MVPDLFFGVPKKEAAQKSSEIRKTDTKRSIKPGCKPTFTRKQVFDTPPHTWKWDFGDGTSASGNLVTHTYEKDGIYQVSLWARNDLSQSQVVMGDIEVPMVTDEGNYLFLDK